MLKGQDIVVLAALLGRRAPRPTLPALSRRLSLDVATVHRSLARLEEAGLVSNLGEVQFAQADEFLSHGLRYVFPPRMKGETRGIPTAWAAAPLRNVLTAPSESPPVWPHPLGETRGVAFEPLHSAVPDVALRDSELYERFALIDALRTGDARTRELARRALQEHFVSSRAPERAAIVAQQRHVVPEGGEWVVRKPDAERISSRHATQREADRRAAQILRNIGGGERITHGRDGTIRSKETIGPGTDANPSRDRER